MTGSDSFKAQFAALQACVIIPTYNNAATLAGVIEDVAGYTQQIIVVNDGSTDGTLSIIQSFPFVKLITYPKNVGKGWALRKAFALAIESGFQYAVCIDSDGQHFAKDLPAFIEKLKEIPGSIIIGSRNMDQSSVPGKSSFGYKVSNFWFTVETGIKCADTQSGYRLYPLAPLKKMHFFTKKYEFEIEVLVRSAWKGVRVDAVPVSVYYAPPEIRVSHFRPRLDFFRISILNTILVIIAFLYIKPRDFFRNLFKKGNFRQMLSTQLLHPHHSAQLKAVSVAFGIFMGIIPIWGFQLVSAIFLAVLFKLNKALVIIAANISVPPMIPLIIFLSYKTGAFWMGSNAKEIVFNKSITIGSIKEHFTQYIYGSITLAITAGVVFGLITFLLLKLFSRKTAVVR